MQPVIELSGLSVRFGKREILKSLKASPIVVNSQYEQR
jgi:hypothetical protein